MTIYGDPGLDRQFERVALGIWSRTYRTGAGDSSAWDLISQVVAASIESEGDEEGGAGYFYALTFGAKWLDCGRVTLITPTTFGAALMSTDCVAGMDADIQLPWDAFLVSIPNDLLGTDDLKYHAVCVARFDRKCVMSLRGWCKSRNSHSSMTRLADNFKDLLFENEHELVSEGDGLDLDAKERAFLLARRLVIGLLYTIQYTDNFRDKTHTSRRKCSRRDGPPPHRVYIVGKPIGVDCRPAISAYLSGRKSTTPALQSLVRGHYKRQAIGPGGASRKVIWIQPYWRGPEDAPILARSYRVGA